MKDQVTSKIFAVNNPLSGMNGIVVFVSLGFLGLLIDLLVCWTYLALTTSTKVVAIDIFVVSLLVGWLAFSMAENVGDFVRYGIAIVVLFTPLLIMAFLDSDVFFWITLILMVLLAVVEVLRQTGPEDTWTKIITATYSAWVVAGVFVTLGSPRLFGYAASAANLSEFHFLLDARYLITIILLLSAFGRAMFNAFEVGLPKIPPAPKLASLDDSQLDRSPMGMILRPMFVFANVLIMIARGLLNLTWRLVGYIVTYLYRTGKNLAHEFYHLVTDMKIVKAVGKVVATFGIALIYSWLLRKTAPDFIRYLVSTTSLLALSTNLIVTMARLGFFSVVTIGSVLILTRLWKSNERVIEQAAFGGSMILVGLALSAAVVYVLAKTGLLAIVGFESIGVLTLLLILLLGSVFVYHVAQLATKGNKTA